MSPLVNTYLTIFGALAIVFFSAQMPFVTQNFVGVLLATFLLIVLIFAMAYLQPGPMKWMLFLIFAIVFGQILHASVQDAKMRGVLSEVLTSVAGIVLAMTAVAFLDSKDRFLGFGTYLFAALVGLVIARFTVIGFGIAGADMLSLSTASQALSWFSSGLFAVYLAYDTQLMRKRISKGKNNLDYVDMALGPFLDIVNLFASVEDLY